ncbi:MAG TPA: CAP domain-containing protein, partial [Polyangiaceae bacterium]|nr:CAP domain-containing protein [Polyangiaceae bacterium]
MRTFGSIVAPFARAALAMFALAARPQRATAKEVHRFDGLCPEIDVALKGVAADVAAQKVDANDGDALARALHAAGDPHVWPRAIVLEGKTLEPSAVKRRLESWFRERRAAGRVRCGAAFLSDQSRSRLAVVSIDAEADLHAVPREARTHSWVDIDALSFVPAYAAKVVVLPPVGPPRSLPTSFSSGHVRARANLDRPGAWVFQVVLDGDAGPRPVLETTVFAGVAPQAADPKAPGEDARLAGEGDAVLREMVTVARRTEGLPPLGRDENLERAALAHAERMMRAGVLAHDVGSGDPRARAEAAGSTAVEIGENVAHARTTALAHRALWASPSHRQNMLDDRF